MIEGATDFLSVKPRPMKGNTPWASRYAEEIRTILGEHNARTPRTLQRRLGPSELGVACDRQVVGKMAGTPATNHVFDPWPSFVGTAVHVSLAEMFDGDNLRKGVARWLTEQKVTARTDISGTGDLYDAQEACVGDHKVLGVTSLAKVKRPEGPPRKYQVQLLLYGLGFINLGLPVSRVALIAYPRTKSTLDDLYVWERPFDGEAVELLDEVFQQTDLRRAMSELLTQGLINLMDVPATPSQEECYFCPLYRPSGEGGCPGK